MAEERTHWAYGGRGGVPTSVAHSSVLLVKRLLSEPLRGRVSDRSEPVSERRVRGELGGIRGVGRLPVARSMAASAADTSAGVEPGSLAIPE